jgi:hypothetical protein
LGVGSILFLGLILDDSRDPAGDGFSLKQEQRYSKDLKHPGEGSLEELKPNQ